MLILYYIIWKSLLNDLIKLIFKNSKTNPVIQYYCSIWKFNRLFYLYNEKLNYLNLTNISENNNHLKKQTKNTTIHPKNIQIPITNDYNNSKTHTTSFPATAKLYEGLRPNKAYPPLSPGQTPKRIISTFYFVHTNTDILYIWPCRHCFVHASYCTEISNGIHLLFIGAPLWQWPIQNSRS